MAVKKSSVLILFTVIVLLLAGCASSSGQQPSSKATINVPAQANPATITPTADVKATSEDSSTSSSGPIGAKGGLVVKIDPLNSEARYRVREQLVKNDLPNDAVGRTKNISGSITIKPDGTIDTASSKIVVDVSSLQTDQNMRDNFVRRNVLQTSQYPQVTFVPTQVSGLTWPLPQSGPVTFKLTGDLTIRDVTKPVTWEVKGNIQNGENAQASGTATTSFKFEDFNIQQPQVPVVLSIVDNITLEVDVALQAGGQ
jgi:polyisoprenoid-binding protein YceI